MKKGKNEEGKDEKNTQIKEWHYEERKWWTTGKKKNKHKTVWIKKW